MLPSLVLPFADTLPSFGGEPVFAGPRSAVLGRATIGAGAWLGEDSVVRADGDVVHIGRNVHLGHRATVHIVHELLPCLVGDDVTVGANAIVHACTVGDRCVLEDDVVILDANNGREVLRVTTDGASWAPAWSPVGDAITFLHIQGQIVDLRMARLAGSAPDWTVADTTPLTEVSGLDGASRPGWFVPPDQLPSPTPGPSASAAASPAASASSAP